MDAALQLRAEERYEESRQAILALLEQDPENPVLLYQAAWAHDVMGLETEAVPFYEAAIANGLPPGELSGALLGLGSTYRAIGAYDKAVETLSRGAEEFPEDGAFRVFLAMALYNTGAARDAVGLLLNELATSSSDPHIQRYRRAIAFYADRLDEIWG
jgi:tetratricopeptide (TPR) repeat protein